MTRWFALGGLLTLAGMVAAAQESGLKAKEAFFLAKVAPVLNKECLPCHGDPKNASGLLLLNSREAMLKGGASGPAVIPGKPSESHLIKSVKHESNPMPPSGKLKPAEIEALVKWVQDGAVVPAVVPKGAEHLAQENPQAGEAAKPGGPKVDARAKSFWSFVPVKRPPLPKVKNSAWVRNPIDAFVLAKLESKGMKPNPPASKAALLRRVTYDLTGLPPTAEEVKTFLQDTSPKAYEKVVERLLASPRYGERWARHWMDVVRYAETNSFERDDPKPFVWRYRDYLIRSLNDDKPYDRFTLEQIAGDELPDRNNDTLIATGYYRLGIWDDEPSDPEQAKYDDLDDIVATTGQTWLGLTINCARCHEHKIDPIPHEDYYRFLAVFHNVRRFGVRGYESVAEASLRSIAPPDEQKRFEAESQKHKDELRDADRELFRRAREIAPKLTPVQREEFRDEGKQRDLLTKLVPSVLTKEEVDGFLEVMRKRDRMRRNPPKSLEQALCVTESGRNAPDTFVLLRGNPQSKGSKVQPAVLSTLSGPKLELPEPAPDAKSTGRRLALAKWMASPANPLTPRVMVNRVWHWHFGRGLVRSTSNFGYFGNAPTHPELLEWLSSEFVSPSGMAWKLKPLHRMIALSNTYRMSSAPNPSAHAKDPENDLLWRFDMRRLSAEEIRDSILAVNGSLNLAMYGPSVYPKIPAAIHAGQSIPGYGWPTSSPKDGSRRSVYVHIKRSLALPMFASFDGPDPDSTCPVRFVTTQPTQALGMMNSEFLAEQAKLLAKEAIASTGNDSVRQATWVLNRVTQRTPAPAEVARAVKMMDRMKVDHRLDQATALHRFCIVAYSLNEFLWLD